MNSNVFSLNQIRFTPTAQPAADDRVGKNAQRGDVQSRMQSWQNFLMMLKIVSQQDTEVFVHSGRCEAVGLC